MGRARNRELELLSLLGYMAWLTVGHSRADGGVFLLDLENGSKGGHETGFEAATNACMAQGAQVASKEDLHHAVLECAFSACSRGWLSGPSIGTTVCNGVQGNLRPVDVQVENVTSDIERLGVFCVKDSDSPCGQPPSFPNSHLQGKTGLDLGDELLYACNQGYKLPDGQMAFSLVCDSCGEWYGLSHCVKDDPEGHIDYEDKFTDSPFLVDPREVHDGGATETIDHEADEPTSEPEHQRTIISKENDDLTVLATESSVSQISQKHMFWFPSEGFQVPEEPSVIITDSFVKNPTEDQSHMTDKTSDHQTQAEVITEGHDPDYDQTTDPPTDDHVSPSVGSTEDSWIDGYPVSQGEDKVRGVSTVEAVPDPALKVETPTGSPDVEVFEDMTKRFVEEETGGYIHSSVEPIEGDNNNPEDVKYKKVIHTKEGGTTTPEKDGPVVTYYEEPTKGLTEDEMKKKIYVPKSELEQGLDGVTETPNAVHMRPTTFVRLTTSASSADDNIAIHRKPMIYTPAYAPENVSTSQEGLEPEHATTPSGMGLMDSTPVFVDDITNMPTPIIKVSWETNDSDNFLEHVPVHEIPDERDGDQTLDHQEGEGACAEDPCRAFGRWPMVAAIIIGIAAAVLGVVLGVWCYKRRQQKSSHYQLNGTNTQTQCIELQQTV